MKKFVSVLLVFVMLFALFSCDDGSSYSAVMLKKSSGGDDCEAEFGSLSGRLVLHAHVRDKIIDGTVHYEAFLAEGEMNVYYKVNDGTEELLFNIKGGERFNSRGGSVKYGDKVTIIIETVGTAKSGEVDIDFD